MCECVRSLYRSGLHKTVARELAKYGLDLVGVPYFPAHKMHCDFFVRNFRKKKK
jgi:hypothetical protein